MKIIVDFDDTLFHNTKMFKEHMFSVIEKAGIARNIAETSYKEVRSNEFSLRNFLTDLFSSNNLERNTDLIYEEIMEKCPEFLNTDVVEIIKEAGKDNSYIVTNGDYEFQWEKIKRSGVDRLFIGIHVVPKSKKIIVEEICRKNNNHSVIFADNRADFFSDLDTEKYTNLKTILFDENGLEKLRNTIQAEKELEETK